MSELEEKLNALLSDPNSMAQVMQMAQQLSGAMGEQKAAPPPPAPPPGPDLGAALGGLDPKLLGKLLPLAGELGTENSAALQLLQALRPFLKEEKQGKIERAARLARLIHVGKKAAGGLGGVAMYNRYIRNDNGVYDRVPQQETAPPSPPRPQPPPPRPGPPPPGPEPAPPSAPAPERQFLNRLLAKLHLGDMDAGDLLLLLILFFLFYQKADEEVLIAIGLLLIL